MPVPDFQSLMLPVLQFLSDGGTRSSREIREAMAQRHELSDPERSELLPSGTVTRFDNNVSWALSYLFRVGILKKPMRGSYAISERGQAVLQEQPDRINLRYLMRFPEYAEWRKRVEKTNEQAGTGHQTDVRRETPEEVVGVGYQELRNALASDILDHVKSCSPRFFERLVVDLLLKMGYGGTLQDAGQVTGRSGDEGVDGLIKEDKLGLDVIYVQAKRWENVVGRPTVQAFAGSLEGQRAKKGVIITTSTFSNDAREYVKHIEKKIVLIDGYELAQLMMDHDVGVTTVTTYAVKRIDSDYFEEE